MKSSPSVTPAMAQYWAAKKQHPDALLFFRMGDFYEMFHDDAVAASRELGITLTSRSKGDSAIPMAGVPVRAVDNYLGRLVKGGHKVAVCEQMEDPREAKGVVKRQVIRVITPGTLTEDNLLEQHRPNHLAAVSVQRGRAGVAWVELSTGAFVVTECAAERLHDELQRIDAAEILLAEEDDERAADLQQARGAVTRRPAFEFGTETATRALHDFFDVATLDAFGLGDLPLAVGAAGALIAYLRDTQLASLPHIARIEVQAQGGVMVLDRATRASLELVETMRGDGRPLLEIIDRTRTPMGARLLREWLLSPLTDLEAIGRRHESVGELYDRTALAETLHGLWSKVYDLQRLTTRVACGRANARDLLALQTSLEQLPAVRDALATCETAPLTELCEQMDPLADIASDLAAVIADEPPITIREGGVIRDGYNAELDELRTIGTDSKAWIARFQAEEAARTGIANLKIGFNKVFGYYIEITHGNSDVPVPESYVRKQTTKNAERYITDELKSFETKVLKSEELARELEYDLFCQLRDRVAAQTGRLQATAQIVAELDAFTSLAVVARERDFHRPVVDDSRVLNIADGRHPVIEATHLEGSFVPNDTDLDPPARRLVLLTGPNMAGKSTYIRQNALIVLLAQVGSFVPARSAHIGVVDRIFTRVGASDDISRGASTFMVEMTETAAILHGATARSLVILDEVGRGTSTYDGLALAWAIAEDLHDRIGCRALFATHYHQLIDLAGPGKGVVNQRVAVKEWGEEIVFLHRIEDGGTDRSYGLHVGRLAGIPRAVLQRAREVLERLEDEGDSVRSALAETGEEPRGSEKQLPLFEAPRAKVLRELSKMDLEQMTPIEAMQKLAEWAEQLR